MPGSRDTRTGNDPGRRLPFKGKRRLYDVIKVRFPNSVKPVECDASDVYVDGNTSVVVRTRRGPVLARTVGTRYRKVLPLDVLQPIERAASQRDIERQQENDDVARESLVAAVKAARELRLDMKFITAEVMLDRRRTVLYFSAENRVDFRQLVRRLSRDLRTRIEMHQVGVRNGAGMLGGVGSCGRELCCSTFLTDFEPVAIRMVKDQGLTLNPKKVSGMCGRLMCCLVYEHSGYVRGRKRLPRRRSLVRTRLGLGRVRNFDIVQETVLVRHEDGTDQSWPLIEVIVDPDDTESGPSEPLVFTIDGPVTADEAARRTTDDGPPEPSTSRRRRGRSSQRGDGGGSSRGRSRRGRSEGSRRAGGNDASGTADSSDSGESSRRRRRRRRRGRSKPAEQQAGSGNANDRNEQSSASGDDNRDGESSRGRRRRRRRGRSKGRGGNNGGNDRGGSDNKSSRSDNASGDDGGRRRRRRRRRSGGGGGGDTQGDGGDKRGD